MTSQCAKLSSGQINFELRGGDRDLRGILEPTRFVSAVCEGLSQSAMINNGFCNNCRGFHPDKGGQGGKKMHVLVPRPLALDVPLFFNVDSSVGNNGMNSIRVDILLVQFMIRKLGELSTNVSPDRRARMSRVVADGLSGPNTIDGIRAIQEVMRDSRPATIVDGRVSSARGYDYTAGGSRLSFPLAASSTCSPIRCQPRSSRTT